MATILIVFGCQLAKAQSTIYFFVDFRFWNSEYNFTVNGKDAFKLIPEGKPIVEGGTVLYNMVARKVIFNNTGSYVVATDCPSPKGNLHGEINLNLEDNETYFVIINSTMKKSFYMEQLNEKAGLKLLKKAQKSNIHLMKIISMKINRLFTLVTLLVVCNVSSAQYISDILFGKGCKKNYIGQYNYNGKRKNGFGIERYRNGSVYIGYFSEDEISGRGMLIQNNSQISNVDYAIVYVGSWLKGKKNGRGVCYDDKGNVVYNGKFVNDKPTEPSSMPTTNKRFTMQSNDNSLYLGEVIDSIPDGFGLTMKDDGSIVYGTMKLGQLQGICMTIYTPELWEVGQWKDGVYTAFNNSQIAEADLLAFRAASKEWKKEMRSSLLEAAGNFAQTGLNVVTTVNEINGNSPTATASDVAESGQTNGSKRTKGSKQEKKASLANWKTLDRAYGGYEDQLIQMKSSGAYDKQGVRNIQSKMREIRAIIKKQSGGHERAISPLETWNP